MSLKKKPVKRSGVDDNEYEQNVCTYLMLKAGFDSTIEDFQLLNNVNGAGSFDDILLSVFQRGVWEGYIMQVKHSKNNSLEPETFVKRSNFLSLSKECFAYEELKSYYDVYETKCGLEVSTVILFTNAKKEKQMDTHIICIPDKDTNYNIPFKISVTDKVVKFSLSSQHMVLIKGSKKPTKITTISIEKISETDIQMTAGSSKVNIMKSVMQLDFIIQVTKNNSLTICLETFYESLKFGFVLKLPPCKAYLNLDNVRQQVDSLIVDLTDFSVIYINEKKVCQEVEFLLELRPLLVMTAGFAFVLKADSSMAINKEMPDKPPVWQEFCNRVVVLGQQAEVQTLQHNMRGILSAKLPSLESAFIELQLRMFVKKRCEQGTLFEFTRSVWLDKLAEVVVCHVTTRSLHVELPRGLRLDATALCRVRGLLVDSRRVLAVACCRSQVVFLRWAVCHCDVPPLDEKWVERNPDQRAKEKRLAAVRLGDLAPLSEYIVRLLRANIDVILVIDCTEVDDELEVSAALSDLQKSCSNKIVALLDGSREKVSTRVKDSLTTEAVETLNFSLTDLDAESRKRLLQREVALQGCAVVLNAIAEDSADLWEGFSGSRLSQLALGDALSVALLPRLRPPDTPYLSRSVALRDRVNIELCLHDPSQVYVVEGAAAGVLERLDNRKGCLRTAAPPQHPAVHFLAWQDGEFVYRQEASDIQ